MGVKNGASYQTTTLKSPQIAYNYSAIFVFFKLMLPFEE